MEDELGEERQLNLFDAERMEREDLTPPEGPDHRRHRRRLRAGGAQGGILRSDRRDGAWWRFGERPSDEVAEAEVLRLCQTYRRQAAAAAVGLMKLQGLQDHQQVVLMSDGGDDVRRVQDYLQPGSEHWIDWFHITMRHHGLAAANQSLQGEADPSQGGGRSFRSGSTA